MPPRVPSDRNPQTPAVPPRPDNARVEGPAPRLGRRARILLLGLAVGLPLVVGVVLLGPDRPEPRLLTDADVRKTVDRALARAAEAPARSSEVFQTILPSLVFIRTEGFEQGSREGSGVGSGVIVSDSGIILTANHVVTGARSITVTFADGTEARAEVVETYPNDLAILRAGANPELIVPAVLAGGSVQVGDEAFAVGNPLGLTASLSAGVISGLGRTLAARQGGADLTGLIQFDAAVNPGSSGGPLLDREGRVIGIVTALANPTSERSFTGIGFAVPLGTAGGLGGLPR